MRKNKMKFLRFIEGDGTNDPQPGGGTPPEPTPEPPAPKAGDDPAGENPAGQQPKGFTDLDAANAEIERLRKENGKDRVNAKTKAAEEAKAELIADLAKALGITKTEEVTVESLQEQLTAEKAEATKAQEAAQAAALQLAVYKAAGAAKADADLLLDSARFQATLADIDVNDSKAVTDQIKDWVQKNPKFAATQVVGASTIEHPGGTGESSITKERFSSMSIAEKTKLRRDNPAAYDQLVGK